METHSRTPNVLISLVETALEPVVHLFHGILFIAVDDVMILDSEIGTRNDLPILHLLWMGEIHRKCVVQNVESGSHLS